MRLALLLPLLLTVTPPVAPTPWGPEVFDHARRTERAVLLIVGDARCARCALDESEAMADAATARLLERSFVVTRVDRFERPDLDDLYGTAVTWLGGRRSYPLALALLPDGRPFAGEGGWSGEDHDGAPSLHRIALRAWSEFTHDRAEAEARAARTVEALQRAQRARPAPLPARPAAHALAGLAQAFDARTGGFGAGPAFAPPAVRRLLLTVLEGGEDPHARRMLEPMLDALLAVEPDTLAERALLIETLARAHPLVGAPAHARRVAALIAGAPRPGGGSAVFTAEAPGWNGLMIGALALSGSLLERPQDVAAAREVAAALLQQLGPPTRWRRRDGGPALLEDYAYVADGLLRLDTASKGRERRWVDEAAAVADAAIGRYYDPEAGGFFDALPSAERYVPPALPARVRNGFDGVLPSANGVMAGVLLRLAAAAAQPRYAELGRRTVEAFGGVLQQAPRGLEGLAAAALQLGRSGPPEVASDGPLPARAEHDGVRFEAEVASRVRPGQRLSLVLRLDVPAGRQVIAHEPGAPDLVGLSVSVPASGAAAAAVPSYPVSRIVDGRWGTGRVNVYEGRTSVEVPLAVPAAAPPGPARVRVRAVFQVCREGATVCERARTVLLDAPFEVAPEK
jgi:uncharacterized protein YyaL (SSP411 family)